MFGIDIIVDAPGTPARRPVSRFSLEQSAVHLPDLPAPCADPAPYLAATDFFDLEHPLVSAFVRDAGAAAGSPRERAVALFYAVRDRIRYDPYGLSFEASAYRASAVINDEVLPTSDFLRNPDWRLPAQALKRSILEAAGERDILFIDAQSVALALMGDALYGNPLLLGYAWQQGWVPLGRAALRRAIELNGVSVAANLEAFEWGRRYAHDPAAVRRRTGAMPLAPAGTQAEAAVESVAGSAAGSAAGQAGQASGPATAARSGAPAMATIQVHRRGSRTVTGVESLQSLLDDRAGRLRDYQDDRWAGAYRDFIGRVRDVEQAVAPGSGLRLSDAVARGLFKLMAYKDEYEVCLLYTSPSPRD